MILVIAAIVACRRAPARDAALAALVAEVAVPEYQALAGRADALVDATAAVAATGAAALPAAREAWRAALVALATTSAFRLGPIAEQNLHLRAAYWPIRPAGIDALVGADAAAVARAGVAVKGLYAIESLLFDARAAEPARAALARRLAEDLAAGTARARDALRAWDARAAFAADAQRPLGRLVNDMIETVETVVTGRFDLVEALRQQGGLGQGRTPAERSGSSRDATHALLEGVRRLYAGGAHGGLAALVAPVAGGIDGRVRQALDGALAATDALGGSLEQAIARDPEAVRRARAASHALEVALKADLASALGVTLTFRSVDGD